MQTGPDQQLADPTRFGYYTTHDSTNELKNQILTKKMISAFTTQTFALYKAMLITCKA